LSETTIGPAALHLHLDLATWAADGLLAIFFFVAGLELKREFVAGDLRDPRRAALPVVAALGGVVVPALTFTVITVFADQGGTEGWAIPTATDIAFALAVLAVLGSFLPAGLRTFLLTLAVVDDLGGIVLIAVVYSGTVSLPWLAASLTALAFAALLRRRGVHAVPVYVALAALCWLALSRSGVEPTMTGVAFALLTPARPGPRRSPAAEPASPLDRVIVQLTPWVSYLIVPAFALANAGLRMRGLHLDAVGSRVAIGVVVAFVVGKPVGILLTCWAACRLRVGALPRDSTWTTLAGAAICAGIGFTVALFITRLSLTAPADQDAARLGILVASVLSAVAGLLFVALTSRRGSARPPCTSTRIGSSS
jgi:NhaA family Na+:H+ antiporter